MYIKMNDDKSLSVTVPTTIYRGERKADLITFLVPSQYEDINLADCAMILRYIQPDGTGKSEPLAYLPEMYKTYLQFSTVVNTRFSAQAGMVTLWLTAIGDDGVVLKTGEVMIEISPSKDVQDYLCQEDLDQLDQLMAQIEALSARKADDMIFHEEDSTVQLLADGEEIGRRIPIGTASEEPEPEEPDGTQPILGTAVIGTMVLQ